MPAVGWTKLLNSFSTKIAEVVPVGAATSKLNKTVFNLDTARATFTAMLGPVQVCNSEKKLNN